MLRIPKTSPVRVWLVLIAGAGLAWTSSVATAQENGETEKRPVLFITVESPLTDVQKSRVTNAALKLQTESVQRQHTGLMFLEIQPGSSEFYDVLGLAAFLTTDLPDVTTVAFVPKTVTGNNVILALACREIVMASDAELGDIGRGEVLEETRQNMVLDIQRKSKNPNLSEALVQKMMDNSVNVYRITLQKGEGPNATKAKEVVTGVELKQLQDKKAVIEDITPLLEGATVGLFSGDTARRAEVLIKQTAQSQKELADAYKIQLSDLRERSAVAGDVKARLIKIQDTLDPMKSSYIQRLINRAVSDGANLIIFEIDSPGGYEESMRELRYAITDLTEKNVRTVAYIPDKAWSAAAVIALACDEIYMLPEATIGDAGLIANSNGQEGGHVQGGKLEDVQRLLAALAEEKHRPAALLTAMANPNLVVYEARNTKDGRITYMSETEIHDSAGEWEQVRPIEESERAAFLTLTGKRAHEVALAEPPVTDIEELKQRLGIPAETDLDPMKESWVDTLIFRLNSPQWTGMLFTIAMLCLFMELHLMSGLLAIVSGLCFALFFWARYMGGTAGWLEVILFVGGLICLSVEIFLLPGFGVFGISGGLMVLASLILASQTFGDSLGGERDMEKLTTTVKTLTISLAAVVTIAAVINRYLPHIPLFNAIILHPPNSQAETEGPKLRPGIGAFNIESQHAELYGMTGVAQSVLRPAGKARIGDRLVDVISNGPYIQAGAQIEVVEVAGNRVVVREV